MTITLDDIITHYTSVEGGIWKEMTMNVGLHSIALGRQGKHNRCPVVRLSVVEDGVEKTLQVHSLRFASGKTWDVTNGFRSSDQSSVGMGSQVLTFGVASDQYRPL